jgi:hypothetical protein
MIHRCRATYQEEVWGVFLVHESSERDHNLVGFDEMAYVINKERSRMLALGWCNEQVHNDCR